MPHRTAIALVAATLSLAVPPSLAGAAGTATVASQVSIHGHGLTFSGRVTSPKGACESGRHVVLHRTNGQRLGSVATGPAGHWALTVTGSAGISLGRFFATVKRSSRGASGARYVCAAARSATIAFQP